MTIDTQDKKVISIHKDQIAELERRHNILDSESLLKQLDCMGALLQGCSNAELDRDVLGWAGSLVRDLTDKLELCWLRSGRHYIHQQ